MTVFIAGQVGLEKEKEIYKIGKTLSKCGTPCKIYHVGKQMCRELKTTKEKILERSFDAIRQCRRHVFENIINEVKSDNKSYHLINTHATFRWRRGLFFAFDFDQLKDLGIDMFITIVDNVDTIKVNLEKRRLKHSAYPRFKLKDIMVWREEECIVTESISQLFEVPYFVVPLRDAEEIISELLLHPKTTRCYTSYPISYVKTQPDKEEEIIDFISQLRKKFVVFDPYAIDEKQLFDSKEYLKKDSLVPLREKGVNVPYEELDAITYDIDGQIEARDFKFIEQSDIVILYVPTLFEMPIRSNGQTEEANYGRSLGKEVHLIWTAKTNPSPWLHTDKRYESLEDFLKYVEKHFDK